jgi:hypothetical protein
MWLTFLMGAIAVPERASGKALVLDTSAFDNAGIKEVLSGVPLEVTALRR